MAKPYCKATGRQIIEDAEQVLKAVSLIQLGARMPVLQQECDTLSWDRLSSLYREIQGSSPPKGLLPFSTEWFMVWRNNIHASLFYNIFAFLKNQAGCDRVDGLTKGFRLYREHCAQIDEEPALDLTRAWTLIRFFEGEVLQLSECCDCGGKFVAYMYDPAGAACRICRTPSRAVGQKRKERTASAVAV